MGLPATLGDPTKKLYTTMSYEIASSITIVGDKIKIKSHSNNVFPKYDHTSEFPANDEGFHTLLKCLDQCTIQPVPSANDYKWSGIMDEIEGLEGEERFAKFKELAMQSVRDWYVVRLGNGWYIAKAPRYTASKYVAVKEIDNALKMRKAKAKHVAGKFKNLEANEVLCS